MDVGIVGLPRCGKTTLFNALTGMNVDGFGEKAHVGVANIPDPRLHTIAERIPTQKVIPATIKFVDLPGVASGDGKKLNALLEQIRQVDAICCVARGFDDGRPATPAADMAAMEVELVLADLVVAEGARDKATRNARSGEAEAKKRLDLLQRVCVILEEERPLRTHDGWTDGDRMLLRSYGFITAKPVLHVANVGEDEVDGSGPAATGARERAASRGEECVVVCAQLEAELAELEETDRDEMLESLGLSEPAIGPLARAANRALGLTTFYTAGEKEVRAWAIPIGAAAPAAAGTIHSDIERGFIRAECYGVDDLVQYGDEKTIKEAGKMRSEGKGYAMQDGDVVHFLFNV